MKIYHSIEEYAKTGAASHVALGFFDGVHLGHRAVIGDCVAHKGGCRSVVLTFGDSPARLLGKPGVRLITDNARKAQLIETLGVDALIFADFARIRELEAGEFIRRVLHEQLRAEKVSCGENYRFGSRGAGNTAMLREQCAALGIRTSVVEPVGCDGRTVSSSAIRALLLDGEIAAANRMLGSAFAIGGAVGSGNHIGARMGFPTVNLPIADGMVVPRFGVYAARVTVGGRTYRGATNIGVHPTVGANTAPLCETFLPDYRGADLYGANALCELLAFIRPEKRFRSTEELTAQIEKDIEQISAEKWAVTSV